MVYTHKNSKGVDYDLYMREVELKGGGRTQVIYFFTKHGNTPNSGKALEEIPEGKVVGENKATGLPYLANA